MTKRWQKLSQIMVIAAIGLMGAQTPAVFAQPDGTVTLIAGRQSPKEFLMANRSAIENNPSDAVMGNRKGKIILVEFFDYHCGYCKAVVPSLQHVLASEPDVKLVLKQFPILSESSVMAAQAVLAARAQGYGRDVALHDRLMGLKGRFGADEIFAAAKAVGLNLARLRHDMADPRFEQILVQTAELAENLAIRGTPGFVLGDRIIRGAIDEETLRQLIAEAKANLALLGT
ncbi:MAG: DsbA family protein [Alphaproteobacteria bacterium]|nr:DsbA family protein [Alphaproteobacteria bacterium]